jgi:hypothetical protein
MTAILRLARCPECDKILDLTDNENIQNPFCFGQAEYHATAKMDIFFAQVLPDDRLFVTGNPTINIPEGIPDVPLHQTNYDRFLYPSPEEDHGPVHWAAESVDEVEAHLCIHGTPGSQTCPACRKEANGLDRWETDGGQTAPPIANPSFEISDEGWTPSPARPLCDYCKEVDDKYPEPCDPGVPGDPIVRCMCCDQPCGCPGCVEDAEGHDD